MTKQGYIKLAEIIKLHQDYVDIEHAPEGGKQVIFFDGFLFDLCKFLKSDNPRFDEETFRKACEY
jgi:hypothetical protein